MSGAPKLLKPAEAGQVVGVSADTIRRWVRNGYTRSDGTRAWLRAVDVGTPTYPRLRIRDDDLADLIEQRTYAALRSCG